MNIQSNSVTWFSDLYQEARNLRRDSDTAIEETKKNTFRVGTAGCLIDGEVYGKCHRLALLRYLGIQKTISNSTMSNFEAGWANETTWFGYLDSLKSDKYFFNRTYEVKSEVKTDAHSYPLFGHPDIIAIDKETASPLFGLELKAIVSGKKAISILCEGPEHEHIIQASNYMRLLGIPFNLVYTFPRSSLTPFLSY